MKKILKTKLTKTRAKVKTNWVKFQQEKTKILNRHIGSELKQKKIKELRKKTYNRISNEFTNYGLFKDKVLHIERDFKKYKQTHIIKGYKLKSFVGKANEKSLQNYLTNKLKDKDKIKSLLIIFQYKKISTGEIVLKTESFSQSDFLKYLNSYDAEINQNYNENDFMEAETLEGLSIFNLVQMKFERISDSYLNDLKIEKIYIKVYYED